MINNKLIVSKLNNYAVFASTFLFTHNLNAEIVYTDIEPDVTLDNDYYNYEIDIDEGGINDFQLLRLQGVYYSYFESVYRSFTALFFQNLAENKFFAGSYFTVGSAMYSSYQTFRPYVIPDNYSVGPLLSFQSQGWPIMVSQVFDESHNLLKSEGNWVGVDEAYIGIRMGEVGEAHYGWIRVTITENPLSMIIHDFAYETTLNKPIRTGETFSPVANNAAEHNFFVIYELFTSGAHIQAPLNTNWDLDILTFDGKVIYSRHNIVGSCKMPENIATGLYIAQIKHENHIHNMKILL